MCNFFHFDKTFFGHFTAIIVTSFIVSGCQTGNEPAPVPQFTIKEDAIQSNTRHSHNRTEPKIVIRNKDSGTSSNKDASSIKLPESKLLKISNSVSNSNKNANFKGVTRDPFTPPPMLLKQHNMELQTYIQKKQNSGKQIQKEQLQNMRLTQQNKTGNQPPHFFLQEPCIAGIFNNGKEKFALVRWQQVQGIFRKGETLGNGYYIKEITTTSVLLCPEQNNSETEAITLTLH